MVKVARTFPAPASLAIEKKKSSGSYVKQDVIDQLCADFDNKCYICNMANIPDIQVEHLVAHKGNLDLKFDWNNLFLSCPHCNSVKNCNEYSSDILNCCEVDPEQYLDFISQSSKIYAVSRDTSNLSANKTANLITDVFNQKNTGIRIKTCERRAQLLNKEMSQLYRTLSSYQKQENQLAYRKLRALLNRKSAFSAFKRAYVKKYASNLQGDLCEKLLVLLE